MQPFYELALAILRAFPQILLTDNALIYWLFVFLISLQYQRVAQMETRLYGITKNPVLEQTLLSMAFGLLGGLIASFLMVFIGVTVLPAGIAYLWILALLLMGLHPRYMCFSYSGGIISLSYLLFGVPKISISGLMGLVAVLHLTEGILIWASGALRPTPIYLKNRQDQVVGGFMLQRFWPVPVIMVMAVMVADPSVLTGLIAMPDWWPLIRPEGVNLDAPNVILAMLPVMAGLGYADLALTQTPQQRSRQSAGNLFLFSGVLLLLSILSSHHRLFQWLAALFSPLGHELVVITSGRRELSGKALYRKPERGVMVLDVLPHSPAETMGLKSRDIILDINGKATNNEGEIREAINEFPYLLEVTVLEAGSEAEKVLYYRRHLADLGAIFVPEGNEANRLELRQEGFLLKFWREKIAPWWRRVWSGPPKEKI
ncbi:MAG: PDZ domain-containing protein [Firmicutes bacterium]|nr:PDZ domain-containing protein [Bacillota bacterium]MCL5039561.1 PDZ domain-containing protein [Bacillota bacterium]